MKKFLVGFAGVILVWSSALTFAEYTKASFSDASHNLLLDEGFILKPVMNLYRNGWANYRCRDNSTSSCYGATQSYLDSMFLGLFPKSYLEDGRLRPHRGTDWFHMSEFPRINQMIRFKRVIYAFLTGLLVFGFGLLTRNSVGISLVAGLGVFCFSSFMGARLGMKPDMPSAAWTVILYFAYKRAFETVGSFKWVGIAAALSALSLGVRFSFVLPFGLFAGAILMAWWFETRSFKRVAAMLGGAGVVTGLAYFIPHHSFWISATEMFWFLNFFAHPNMTASLTLRLVEIRQFIFPNAWPLLFAAALWWKLKPKGALKWAFFFGVPVIWTLLNLKGAWARPHYYLSVSIWSVMLCLEFLPRVKWGPLFAVGLMVTGFFARGAHLWAWLDPQPLYWDRPAGRNVIQPEGYWIVDQLVRPPVSESLPESRVLLFDSLSEPPLKVLERARVQFGDDWNRDQTKMVLSCWDEKVPAPERRSLPALAWAEAVRGICGQTVDIGEHIFPFQSGNTPDFFVVTKFDENRFREMGRLNRGALNPRSFEGSIEGIDYWFSPLVMYRDGRASGRFILADSVRKLKVPFESNCKGRGEVSVSVKGDGRTVSRKISADVRGQTCARWSWVCGLGLEQWWTKRFPVGGLELDLELDSGDQIEIELEARGLERDRCRISFGNFELS